MISIERRKRLKANYLRKSKSLRRDNNKLLLRILKWIWRGWPVLIWALIIISHQISSHLPCIESLPCLSNQQVDKALSFFLNLIGGLLVLYSINSNLGLFRQGGIATLFLKWLKSFPMIKGEPITISPNSITCSTSISSPRIEAYKKPETIEELYKYTKGQISFVMDDIKEQRKYTNQQIDSLSKKVSSQNTKLVKELGGINQQLKSVVIGGFKIQLFGVLLVIYGSYLSFSA